MCPLKQYVVSDEAKSCRAEEVSVTDWYLTFSFALLYLLLDLCVCVCVNYTYCVSLLNKLQWSNYYYFFKDFIYLFMRDTQIERQRHRGEAGSMQGARCGTQSRDPRITRRAKGRHQTQTFTIARSSYKHIYFFCIDVFFCFVLFLVC